MRAPFMSQLSNQDPSLSLDRATVILKLVLVFRWRRATSCASCSPPSCSDSLHLRRKKKNALSSGKANEAPEPEMAQLQPHKCDGFQTFFLPLQPAHAYPVRSFRYVDGGCRRFSDLYW
ncbi:hypothetical protein MHYP_G00136350 [Metynnis hypsauchen]